MPTRRLPILIILALVAGCAVASGGQESIGGGQEPVVIPTPLSLQAIVASEFLDDSGSWTQLGTLPNRVRSGDRLWAGAHVEDGAHVYVVGSRQPEYTFFLLASSAPQAAGGGQPRLLTPEGVVLTEQQATMNGVFVVASREPLEWLEGLQPSTCDQYYGQYPPEEPTDVCGHLAGLYFKCQPARRGPYRAQVSALDVAGRRLHAETQSYQGEPFVVVKLPIGVR